MSLAQPAAPEISRRIASERGSQMVFFASYTRFLARFDFAALLRAFFAAGFMRALAGVCAGVAGAGDRA